MEEINDIPPVDEAQYKSLKVESEKKMKQDTNLRNVTLRISEINIATQDNKKYGIHAGDTVKITKEDIIAILDDWKKTKDIKYYLAEHDADPNNRHCHVVIEFPENSECKFSTLKNKFPYGNIDRCKYGVKNCVQYLIHLNNPEKHQYTWDDVVTNAPAQLELYKIEGKRTKNIKLDYVVKQILRGNIKEFEVTNKIDADLYIKFGNRIKRAFEYMNEESFVAVNRDVQVYVLQGHPRVGKSTFCKVWANKKGKSIAFSSAGKNAVDEYRGQQVFVFDDYNYSVTPIDDMKKILDPHNNAGVAARFKNKSFKNVDTIFICTNTPICEWYRTESKEDREAFFKRISCVLDFVDRSSDFVATYTVNEIVEHENEFVLESVDDKKHIFDLKKYFDVTSSEDRKNDFIRDLEML